MADGTVGDLSLALKGVSYAARAAKMAQLVNTLYTAATSAGGAASATIAPMTGIGAVTSMPALAMLVANLVNSAAAKNAQKTTQGRTKQMQEVGDIQQNTTQGILGAKNVEELRKSLDSEQYGSRTGDLLYDLVQKNLTGYYMQGEHAKGGVPWAPNEKLQNLAAGLQRMGYTQQPGKDPTGLLMSGGGFLDQKLVRSPYGRNVAEGTNNWNKILETLSSRFPTASFAGMKPREEVVQHYTSMFPDVRSLAMYLQGDPNSIQNVGRGSNPMNRVMPDVMKKLNYSNEDINKSWQDWQREVEAMNRVETSGA